jgi:hypothetical protein
MPAGFGGQMGPPMGYGMQPGMMMPPGPPPFMTGSNAAPMH